MPGRALPGKPLIGARVFLYMARVALLAALLVWASATCQVASASESADRVQELLVTRCARCHGSQVRRPKGGFRFASDLRGLASNSRYIRPGDPGASPLLQMARTGHSSPNSAHDHVLPPAELETLRAWVAAGAPRPTRASSDVGHVRTLPHFIGQFHPLAVHFPVALIIAAALAELFAVLRPSGLYGRVARYCLTIGALGTVVASITGWAWADAGTGLGTHGWLALATTCFACGACLFSWRPATGSGARTDRRVYALVLLATLVLLVMTGHQGGQITHGPVQPWSP